MPGNRNNNRNQGGRGGRGGGNANRNNNNSNQGNRQQNRNQGGGGGFSALVRAYTLLSVPADAVMPNDAARLQAARNYIAQAPLASRALIGAALGMLGFTGKTVPVLNVRIRAIDKVIPAKGGFVIMTTPNNLTASITSASPPPESTIGVLSRAGIQYWVMVDLADKNAEYSRGFHWGCPTQPEQVSFEELTKLDCFWEWSIPFHGPDGVATSIRAGFAGIISSIKAAADGDRTALLKVAQAFPTEKVLSTPPMAITGGGLSKQGICCLGAWLAKGLVTCTIAGGCEDVDVSFA